jgi:hypothetical protein
MLVVLLVVDAGQATHQQRACRVSAWSALSALRRVPSKPSAERGLVGHTHSGHRTMATHTQQRFSSPQSGLQVRRAARGAERAAVCGASLRSPVRTVRSRRVSPAGVKDAHRQAAGWLLLLLPPTTTTIHTADNAPWSHTHSSA